MAQTLEPVTQKRLSLQTSNIAHDIAVSTVARTRKEEKKGLDVEAQFARHNRNGNLLVGVLGVTILVEPFVCIVYVFMPEKSGQVGPGLGALKGGAGVGECGLLRA